MGWVGGCCVCGLSLVNGLCCWHSAGAHGVGWSRGSSADSSPLRLGPDPPSPPDGDQVMSRRSQREIRFVSSPTLGSGPPSLLPEVVPPSGPQSVSLCSSFSEPPPDRNKYRPITTLPLLPRVYVQGYLGCFPALPRSHNTRTASAIHVHRTTGDSSAAYPWSDSLQANCACARRRVGSTAASPSDAGAPSAGAGPCSPSAPSATSAAGACGSCGS